MMNGEDELRFRLLASVFLEKSKQAKREIEELTKEIEEYMAELRGGRDVA